MPTWEEVKRMKMLSTAPNMITDLSKIHGLKMHSKLECPFCHSEILLVVNVSQCAIDLLIGIPDKERKPIRNS